MSGPTAHASAITHGSTGKAVSTMVIGGVLAWIAGQSWSVERGAGDLFQVLISFITLAGIAVAAQLIAGPHGTLWLLALAGSLGMTIPWFFALALAYQGQGVFLPSALVLVGSFGVVLAVTWATRRLLVRWAEA